MLGALPRRNQRGVHRHVVEVLFHDGLAFFDDAGDAVAVLAADFLAERCERPLEPRHLPARFLEVRFERGAQLRRARGLRQLRQRLDQLFFGVVGVAELIDERVMQGLLSQDSSPMLGPQAVFYVES